MQASEPPNRDDKFDLAKYYNNLAMLLEGEKEYQLALQYNGRAALSIEDLARPSVTFTIELAQAHTLRGRTLQAQGAPAKAEKEYRQAIGMFAKFAPDDADRDLASFHERYGAALFQLGTLRQDEGDFSGAREMFSQAVEQHAAAQAETNLAFDYYWLAEANLALGAADQAQKALDQLAAALPKLAEADRGPLRNRAQELKRKLDDRKRKGPNAP